MCKTTEEIEEAARKSVKAGKFEMLNYENNGNFEFPEIMLYLAFVHLYGACLEGSIPRGDAARIKGKLLREYRMLRGDYEKSRKLHGHMVRMWRNVSEAACLYGREPTIEHADRFFEAVYGAKRKIVKDRCLEA